MLNRRKIYFDGYLPPGKWDVRRERLLGQSQHMKALVTSQPFGSSRTPETAFSDLTADMNLTRQFGRSSADTLPKPPFMVPAVLEALRNNEEWGSLVLVVPGEADMFCAQDVRENGGTLLTSDSDLLIQDLGLEGSVSFFWDIIPADPTSNEFGMVACKISLHNVNSQLGLTNLGGLPRVAFEKQKGNMGFNTALQKARDSREDTLNSPGFRSFMEELEPKEYIPSNHMVLGILSSLDPRISELVIQALLLEKRAVSQGFDMKTSRGPEALSMFLPIVIENRDRRSAWTMSTNVRQIAYGILQNLMHRRPNTIIEYRTLDPSTTLTGRQIDIPSLQDTTDNCAQLTTVLEKLFEGLSSPDMRWLAFAVYQDVEWSTSEQRPPLSATLIHKILSEPEDTENYSWDIIHFAAQFQACCYSLRMEKQILDCVLFLGRDIPPSVQKLHDYLALLPPISEWPTVECMFDMLSKFGNLNGFSMITDMLGIPGVGSIRLTKLPPDSTKSKKRRRQDHNLASQKGRQKRGAKRSPSVNPFAVLSQASQD